MTGGETTEFGPAVLFYDVSWDSSVLIVLSAGRELLDQALEDALGYRTLWLSWGAGAVEVEWEVGVLAAVKSPLYGE